MYCIHLEQLMLNNVTDATEQNKAKCQATKAMCYYINLKTMTKHRHVAVQLDICKEMNEALERPKTTNVKVLRFIYKIINGRRTEFRQERKGTNSDKS